MAATSDVSVKGDRPLQAGGEDKLGFRDVASRIASSLIDQSSDKGFVVGIEGAWGSGKSSLLHLIEEELARQSPKRRPSVINFRPWLVGNRDTLLANLFQLLTGEMNQVALRAGDATGVSKEKAQAAVEAMRKFMGALGKAGSMVELAGDATAIAPIKWVGKAITSAGEWAKGKSTAPPLDVLKERLIKSLRELGHRFVITIDDVDRLDPSEVIEILRLTRSVADFPNVIYLLCYDSEVLAHSIVQATGVKDGRAYLEKIVQLNLMVPKPEPFRLRQWFSDELRQFTSTKGDDELSRLKTVIDFEGAQQLRTPRSVIRALDSVRFFWPPIREARGDLADLVWLQLIKDGNPALYRWIEDYCATAAVLSLGTVRVDDAERAAQVKALHASVEDGFFADHTYRHYFAECLPGMEIDFGKEGNGFKIFERVAEAKRNAAIRDARLASPDHYRLYFALTGPSHAMRQADFDAFWSATDTSPEQVAAVLNELHLVEVAGTLGKADLLLERLKAVDAATLTPARARNILLGFAHGMDEAFRARQFDLSWSISLWDRAERLIQRLLALFNDETREAVIDAMFEHGNAVGWLTTLMRRETFAHGRYGDQSKSSDAWFFTEKELDRVFEAMIGRFRNMSADDILSTIRPIDVLFAWQQAGDEAGPRQHIASQIKKDEGLVETLERLTSIHSSSDRGSYSVLSRNNIGPFLDFDEAKRRIEELKVVEGPLSERAGKLALAFGDNDRF